ncbi:MAG: O-antigen ligase family protein, partial [Coriobacteriia bacterium]|nr:O-antigen ligase family protein [Coriobacteriia bacterium]
GIAWSRVAMAREEPMRWNGVMWLLAVLLGLCVMSALTSMNLPSALFGSYQYRQGLVTMLALAAVVFIVVQVLDDEAGRRVLAAAVVIGGVPVAAYGLVQVFGFDTANWGAPDWALARGLSTLGNPDYLGGYLILPAALALGLALSEERTAARYCWWGAFAVTSTGLLLTQVRAAWLGMLVAGLLMLAFVVGSHVRVQRADWLALGLAVVLLMGAGLWARDGIGRRVEEMLSGDRGAGSGRIAIWQTGVRVIQAHPLLGVGPDSFRFGHYEARSTDHEDMGGYASIADDAHNLPITVGAMLGMPALLVAIAFFGILMARAAQTAFRPGTGAGGAVFAAWFAAVVGHTVHLLFAPPVISSNIIMALGIGVLLSAYATRPATSDRRTLTFAVVTVVAVGLVASATAVSTLVADYHLAQCLQSTGEEAMDNIERSIALAPWSYQYRAQRATMLGIAAEEAAEGGDAVEAAEAAVGAYEDLADFAPAEYLTYLEYTGLLLNLPQLGDEGMTRATEVTERGLRVYPSGLGLRAYGAVACLKLGQYEQAVGFLEQDWDSDPDYVLPGIVYGHALLRLGRYDDAAFVVGVLEEDHPDEEGVAQLRSAVEDSAADVQ